MRLAQLFLFLAASPAWAAIALVSNAAKGGTTGATTGAIDTTGASLLTVVVGSYSNNASTGVTVSDSKSNTWTNLTNFQGSANRNAAIWYANNPVVGASHTFTLTSSGDAASVIFVAAWSGTATVAPKDVDNGNGSATSVTTLASGSVTPGSANELIFVGLVNLNDNGANLIIGSGFTILDKTATNMGLADAYLLQGAAATVNPTWSWSTADPSATVIATFKAAEAGTALKDIIPRRGVIPFPR